MTPILPCDPLVEAEALLAAGRYDSAERVLRHDRRPSSSRRLICEMRIALARGHDDEALAHGQRFLASQPNSRDVLIASGRVAAKLKHYDLAIALLTRAGRLGTSARLQEELRKITLLSRAHALGQPTQPIGIPKKDPISPASPAYPLHPIATGRSYWLARLSQAAFPVSIWFIFVLSLAAVLSAYGGSNLPISSFINAAHSLSERASQFWLKYVTDMPAIVVLIMVGFPVTVYIGFSAIHVAQLAIAHGFHVRYRGRRSIGSYLWLFYVPPLLIATSITSWWYGYDFLSQGLLVASLIVLAAGLVIILPWSRPIVLVVEDPVTPNLNKLIIANALPLPSIEEIPAADVDGVQAQFGWRLLLGMPAIELILAHRRRKLIAPGDPLAVRHAVGAINDLRLKSRKVIIHHPA